jgi:hypothetical protein
MKRGKETRTARGQQFGASSANELMALMFVLVEQAPGAFRLRFVTNDDLLEDLQKQGGLQSFLEEVDKLYAEFRKRLVNKPTAGQPN